MSTIARNETNEILSPNSNTGDLGTPVKREKGNGQSYLSKEGTFLERRWRTRALVARKRATSDGRQTENEQSSTAAGEEGG